MKEIQKYTLERLLATLRLNKIQTEYNNPNVFSFDDAERIILSEIDAVSPLSETSRYAHCVNPHGNSQRCNGCDPVSGEQTLTNEKYQEAVSRLHGAYTGVTGDGSIRCCDNGDFDEQHECLKSNE